MYSVPQNEEMALPHQMIADAPKSAPGPVHSAASAAGKPNSIDTVLEALDDAKAEEVISIDLTGKSSIADAMIIASGRSDRHVNAVADRILRALKDQGHGSVPAEGMETCDWVLIDAGDVVVHVFRPEVRAFYNLEKMWTAAVPEDGGHPLDTSDTLKS